jgi:hypothetical protein
MKISQLREGRWEDGNTKSLEALGSRLVGWDLKCARYRFEHEIRCLFYFLSIHFCAVFFGFDSDWILGGSFGGI